ncbi:hypothetical protein K4I05_1653 [Streptococcus sanguinis]|nr:hypothetical protein [Streptococcus sanguinis]
MLLCLWDIRHSQKDGDRLLLLPGFLRLDRFQLLQGHPLFKRRQPWLWYRWDLLALCQYLDLTDNSLQLCRYFLDILG